MLVPTVDHAKLLSELAKGEVQAVKERVAGYVGLTEFGAAGSNGNRCLETGVGVQIALEVQPERTEVEVGVLPGSFLMPVAGQKVAGDTELRIEGLQTEALRREGVLLLFRR